MIYRTYECLAYVRVHEWGVFTSDTALLRRYQELLVPPRDVEIDVVWSTDEEQWPTLALRFVLKHTSERVVSRDAWSIANAPMRSGRLGTGVTLVCQPADVDARCRVLVLSPE